MGNVIISTYGLTFSRHGKLIHCKQHCRWPKGRHTTDHSFHAPLPHSRLIESCQLQSFLDICASPLGWFWQITFVGSNKMSGCRALTRSSLYIGLVSRKATTVWVCWKAEYFVHFVIVQKILFRWHAEYFEHFSVCRKIFLDRIVWFTIFCTFNYYYSL